MARSEVIKANKKAYAELVEAMKTMEGLEKEVAGTLTTEWLTSNKFMGGLSDSKAQKILEKLERMGYDMDDAYDEFEKQMKWF